MSTWAKIQKQYDENKAHFDAQVAKPGGGSFDGILANAKFKPVDELLTPEQKADIEAERAWREEAGRIAHAYYPTMSDDEIDEFERVVGDSWNTYIIRSLLKFPSRGTGGGEIAFATSFISTGGGWDIFRPMCELFETHGLVERAELRKYGKMFTVFRLAPKGMQWIRRIANA